MSLILYKAFRASSAVLTEWLHAYAWNYSLIITGLL